MKATVPSPKRMAATAFVVLPLIFEMMSQVSAGKGVLGASIRGQIGEGSRPKTINGGSHESGKD